MLKVIIITKLLLTIPIFCYSQGNLVPNPSFEMHDSCPAFTNLVRYASNWEAAFKSPDYFHKCATHQLVQIPYNFSGYQETTSIEDSAYVGFLIGLNSEYNREMVGTSLIDTLTIGTKYFISFKISAASDLGMTPFKIKCYCNKLGVKFFTYKVNPQDTVIDDFAHVLSNSILSDTINWIEFSGSFIADSSYTYLVIGNFFKAPNFYCDTVQPFAPCAYYYIDNVCLSVDSNECFLTTNISNTNDDEYISVYVEKFNNYIVVNIKDWKYKSIPFEVFNSIGQLVTINRISNEITKIDISTYRPGLYLIKVGENVFKIFI